MTERYGPEDSTIPAWEAPAGPPVGTSSERGVPPRIGAAPMPGAPTPGVPTYRSWQPGFMPLRPLNLGDFVTLPVKAIGFNRAVIVGGPLLCVIASLALFTAAGWYALADLSDTLRYNAHFAGFRAETVVLLALALLAYLVCDAAARCLVAPGVSRAVLGERVTLGQAWGLARPRIPQLLLLYLIGFLLVLAGSTVAVLVMVAAPLLAIFGIPALIIAWIYGAVAFGVASTVVILEGGRASGSIRRGLTLVKGNVWRLIGISIVVTIIVSVVSQIVGGIAQIPLVIGMESSMSLDAFIIVSLISLVFSQLISSVLGYSYVGTVGTLMYIDLRIRAEGFDVDLARAAEARSQR